MHKLPFARLSIRHVKIIYCICLSVSEIIPSQQQMVMWKVQVHWQVQEYSVDNSQFWCSVSSVVHKRFLPKLNFQA